MFCFLRKRSGVHKFHLIVRLPQECHAATYVPVYICVYINTHLQNLPQTGNFLLSVWHFLLFLISSHRKQNLLPISQPPEGAGASMTNLLCLQEVSTEKWLERKSWWQRRPRTSEGLKNYKGIIVINNSAQMEALCNLFTIHRSNF